MRVFHKRCLCFGSLTSALARSRVKCSRPRQLEQHSISPHLCNPLQVSVPGEQESFQVAFEDQRLSHLPLGCPVERGMQTDQSRVSQLAEEQTHAYVLSPEKPP